MYGFGTNVLRLILLTILTYIIPADDPIVISADTKNKQQPGETILKDTNLIIRDQDKILVTGAIGSGKSTFLKVLLGLVTYDGSIQINKQEVRDMSRHRLAKYLFYMPQEAPILLSRFGQLYFCIAAPNIMIKIPL